MLRYEILGNITLKINLHNGYAVIAITKWNRNTEKYSVTLYIQDIRHNINYFDLMEDFENIEFDSDIKTIKTDITYYVDNLVSNGYIAKYIDRYEYDEKCFELGNELIEGKGEK